MRFISKLLNYTFNFCKESLLIIRIALIGSCAMLTAAASLMLRCGEISARTYPLYSLARELCSLPVALLLFAIIAVACIQERCG